MYEGEVSTGPVINKMLSSRAQRLVGPSISQTPILSRSVWYRARYERRTNMGSDASKTELEKAALLRFIAAEKYPIDVDSIEKIIGESKPDFTCRTFDGELFAFEVTAICDGEVAQMIKGVGKDPKKAHFLGGAARQIIVAKVRNDYDIDLPIELLCYSDWRTDETDDMVLDILRRITEGEPHQFRRVWYLGEKDQPSLVYGDEPAFITHGITQNG
jgi:hypothetical protein